MFKLKRDRIDKRDYLFSGLADYEGTIPKKVDLSDRLPWCYDQGDLGSCTAQAIASNIKFLVPEFNPSRLFIYYIERMVDGTTKVDCGASIRDGVKQCSKIGCCHEENWIYDITKFAVKPPKKCFTDAKNDLITSYYRLSNSRKEMHKCLASGYPFVVGIDVYGNFGGVIIPMPTPDVAYLGGHAVICIGYDTEKQLYKMKNSWGNSWGEQGNFYLPYEYLESDLAGDLWTIRRFVEGDV